MMWLIFFMLLIAYIIADRKEIMKEINEVRKLIRNK